MSGKILASDFSDVASECSRWGASDVMSGVSSGKVASASSIESVFNSIYNIYQSSSFQKYAEVTSYDGYTLGNRISSQDRDYIIGQYYIDDKIESVTTGLLTYAKTQCPNCVCDAVCNSTCNQHSCFCDEGVHHCPCHSQCDTESYDPGCICHTVCDGACDEHWCTCDDGVHHCECHAGCFTGCDIHYPCTCDTSCNVVTC